MSIDHATRHASKREAIFALLSDLKWHSHGELNEVGGVRYSARLLELKRLGYKFDDASINGSDGKVYRLTSIKPGAPQAKLVKVYLSERDADTMVNEGRVTQTAETALVEALGSFRANKDKL